VNKKAEEFSEADDRLHPAASDARLLVETMWWNFHLPQRNLDAEIYICVRPNLGLTYSGIYIWDDFCRHATDLLYFDTQSYLPMPEGDLDQFSLANGFKLRTVEPLTRYQFSYDGARQNGFALEFEGLAKPLAFQHATKGDQERTTYAPGHFDQVGRVTGDLRLNGTTLRIDCISHRDRSWGAVRGESPGYPPDVDWHSAHFGHELWFQCWLWHGEPVATDLQSGVVYKGGRPVSMAAVERRTVFDSSGLEPRFIELLVLDVEGSEYHLQGRVRNMFPWPGSFNMVGFAGLVEWRLGDRVGYGEVHDGRTVDGSIVRKNAIRNP